MAHEQEEAPRSHRLLAVGAVAFLALATALAFGRVFRGQAPTLKLMAAALASLAVAALLERRSPVLAALASAVGLAFALGFLVFPHTLWHGFLPAGNTFHEIAKAVSRVGQQTRVQVAPTEALRPLLMAAITAMWTATFSTHALAVRSGSPLLAAVPCAALLAFAGIVLGDGPRRGYAALFLAAVLAVLFIDGLRRVRQWGPLRPWRGATRPRLTSTTTTRGARRVTLAAVGVALLIPGILPGFRSPAALDAITGTGSGSDINPLVSVTSSLQRSDPIELFTVKSDHPAYWRWMGLNSFDGDRWTTPDIDVSDGVELGPDSSLPGPTAGSVVQASARVETIHQDFHITAPPGKWLPMAYAPNQITLPAPGPFRFDPEIVAAVPLAGLVSGLEYQVTSTVQVPTYENLNKDYDFSQLEAYTELPEETRNQIRPIARDVVATAKAVTPLEKALAIQEFLTSTHFAYDATVSGRQDTRSLLNFLTNTRKGFCQQFASAMAVMLRSLGIPTRIAVGFTTGNPIPGGQYRVTSLEAHAWPEVLFPGYGWQPFEPTPGRVNPLTEQITTPASERTGGGTGGRPGPRGPDPSHNRFDNVPPPGGEFSSTREGGAQGGGGGPRRSYGGLIALAVAVLLGAAAIVIPAWKLLWRRSQLRAARDPRRRALAAYRVFASRAADIGLARGQGETLPEYRARLQREVRFSDGHLERLTRTAGLAAYAPREITEREASDAVASGRTAISEIRKDVPVYRRVAGLFRPSVSG